MIARQFVRAAVVALLATTGCAGLQSEPHSSRTVCVKRTPPAPLHVAVQGDAISIGERALWALPSDGPTDSPRAFALSSGYAVAFRQGDAIWVGVLDNESAPKGDLYRVGGQGRWLGAPAVRVVGDDVLLAWRDGDEVKLATWHPNGAPEAPRALDAGAIGRFCDGEKP